MTSKTRQSVRLTRQTSEKGAISTVSKQEGVQHYVDDGTPEEKYRSTDRSGEHGKMGKPANTFATSPNVGVQPTDHRPHIEILDGVIQGGEEYLLFGQGGLTKWVAGTKFAFDDKAGLRELKAAGLREYGPKATRDLIERINKYIAFRSDPVIDQFGWTLPHFALQNGNAVSPSGIEPPPMVIPTYHGRMASHGSRIGWRRQVAGLFSGHPIGECMLSAAFAPQLIGLLGLNGNIGVGLAGRSSSGKTSLQLAAASAYGPASDSIGHYRYTLNATVNALDELMSVHRDSLFVLDEMGFMDTPVTQRSAQDLYNLILRLSAGDDRRRLGDEISSGVAHNMVYMTSANMCLAEALAPLPAANLEAAMVRLIMIPVPDRPSGIFESVPSGYASVPEALEALKTALLDHYGVAIPSYLSSLVQMHAIESAALIEGIRRRMEAFVASTSSGQSEGREVRVSRAFALIAAGGELAKHFRILPASFDPTASSRHCLDLVRAQPRLATDQQTIVERLVAWLRANSYHDMRSGNQHRLTDADMESHGAFVAHGVRGRVEVQLTQPVLRRIFPDYSRILQSREAGEIMRKDRNTFQTRRTVRKGHGPERVYCFVIPAGLV
jgi:hypothetical protein